MVNDAAGDHETRVESSPRDATQWMPCSYFFPLISFPLDSPKAISRSNGMTLPQWTCGHCYCIGTRRLTVIEPVPEFVESMLCQVLCGSEIEPRVDCGTIRHKYTKGSQEGWA